MGQSQPGRNTLQRPTRSHRSLPLPHSKTFHISYQRWHTLISVSDDTLTCGWLLSEVIRRFEGAGTIVALRTRANVEILDYWLTRMERTMQPFSDAEELEPVFASEVPENINLDYFEPIKLIGKGGFSQVVEVRKKDTGALYAVKVLSKSFLLKEEKAAQVLSERHVLSATSHPFIVRLHWAFQSVLFTQRSELFLVMDFCPGGELFFHLHNLGRLTEDQALFYFSEILLALEHLHSKSVIYRDLKPENVLLDLDGHVRLTDFGLSKENIGKSGRTYSFCGSPEYMSPEMLRAEGHGRAVDYYSLGALLYEMLTGLPPFYDRNRDKMYDAILNEPLQLPNYVSKAGRSLMAELLEKDPRRRLGSMDGFEEIKRHPWLAKVSWEKVLSKKKPPPFIPNLRLSNFDPEYTSSPISFSSSSSAPHRSSDPFSGFEFSQSCDLSDPSVPFHYTTSHSKSVSDISTNTSESRSQASHNVSQMMQTMSIIVEEEEPNVSPKDIDAAVIKVKVPAMVMKSSVFSDSEAVQTRRKRLEMSLDLIPKNAIPARYEDSELPFPTKKSTQRRSKLHSKPHISPDFFQVKGPQVEQVFEAPVSYAEEAREAVKYWESSDEESIVDVIPDFKPGLNPRVAKH